MKEERAKIREYAISLGVCGMCMYRKNIDNRKYCLYCKTILDKSKAKQRSNPNNCSRCGCNKGDTKYKTCEKCRKK